MKSGLYACAGASATASAAAWAKRFEEPITNESKVYFGFIPAASGRGSGGGTSVRGARGTGGTPAPAVSGAADSAWSTRRCTRRSDPVASLTAARISSRKWLSIHSRVKSFGTARTKVSPSSSAPSTSPNQVWKVVSLSAPCNRAETSSHRPSASNSIGCSTGAATPFPRGSVGDTTNPEPRASMRIFRRRANRKTLVLQGKTALHTGLHSCGKRRETVAAPRRFHGFCHRAGLWTTEAPHRASILARGRRIAGFFSFFSTHEADLPAERAPAEAEAWLPRPHVDACRARDPEAPPGQGAQAPLGVSGAAA